MERKDAFWRFDDPARWRQGVKEWHGAPAKRTDPAEGPVIAFDGEKDAFVVPGNPLEGCEAFTIEARIRPLAGGPEEQRFVHIQSETTEDRALLELRCTAAGWYGDVFVCLRGKERFLNDPSLIHPFDRWTTLTLKYTGSELVQIVDGHEELRASAGPGALGGGAVSVGRRINGISPYRGLLAWVRFREGC